MTKAKILLAIFAILALAIVPLASGQDDSCNVVYLFDAWARATPEGAPTGAVFGLLVNLSNADDTLVSASTDAAEAVELHETIMGDGDVMQMRPVEGGIVIPAGGTAWLKPGGLHVMMMGLTQELEANTTIELTLTFANSGEMTLTVPVREPMEDAMPMGS